MWEKREAGNQEEADKN